MNCDLSKFLNVYFNKIKFWYFRLKTTLSLNRISTRYFVSMACKCKSNLDSNYRLGVSTPELTIPGTNVAMPREDKVGWVMP